MEQWLDSTSSRPFHCRHESNEIEKYFFNQTSTNFSEQNKREKSAENNRDRNQSKISRIFFKRNRSEPRWLENTAAASLKVQKIHFWHLKNFFYLVGKLIDRRQAVDEPRVLLDLFAYFGESVLESLKHDDDNDDEAVDRSRMRAWLCLFALLETKWASLQRL